MPPQDQLKQQIEEMRQDMLAEARADEEHERRLRTDIDYALDELSNTYSIATCMENITDMLKRLNSLGYDITAQELYDLY